MQIKRSQDIEYIVQQALKTGLTAYCRPLPKDFKTPSILVTLVGGTRLNEIDTFDLVLDSRAETDAEANEYLRNAIGVLEAVCNEQTTAIRHVVLNSIGAWGRDPVRPDLAMCSARIRVVAHIETANI
ncbi:MAG TPA: hypothetical protein DCF66_05090 [Lachnospiraceae bacterium]|nr:hypothetical protein [Lachnospiraceae bacterium]